MECPNCKSDLLKKNGHTRHGKQNYRCLECGKQFTENAESNIIPDQTKGWVRRSLLEKVSLNGICRIFNVSMPWLLDFIDGIINTLLEALNAEVSVSEEDEIEVVKLEVDELWSFVGNKKNDQWLWLIFHKTSRQVLAMQIGPRNKKTA
jgi:transposase-like protein